MILSRKFNIWLCLALAPTNVALLPRNLFRGDSRASTSSLDMTLSILPRPEKKELKEIDIDDVLSQTEYALMAAKDVLPSSSSLDKEWSDIQQMQQEIDAIVADKKEKQAPFFRKIESSVSDMQEEIEFAHSTKINKKNAVSKTSAKRMATESVKKVSGQAFDAAKAFFGSKEVQQASSFAAKAIQDGLKSAEMMAATMNKPSQPQQPTLVDVSERDIDISDVLAEAESALKAAEIKAKPVSSMQSTQSTKKQTTNILKSLLSKPEKTPQLVDVSDRNIDIDNVLAEVEAALIAAATTETKTEDGRQDEPPSNPSVMEPRIQQPIVDVSDRDIDISNVLAEAKAALKIAETAHKLPEPTPTVHSTEAASSAFGATISSAAWQKSNSMIARKWAHVVLSLKLKNDRASPIRKSNRAILVYNLSQLMLLHQQFLSKSSDGIALFVKLQNKRLSPVRKDNRANLAHTLRESAIMPKEALHSALARAALYIQHQNDRRSPVRKSNRAILAYTLVQSIIMQRRLLKAAVVCAKSRNDQMQPIRVSNRKNIVHTLFHVFLLQRELLLEGRDQIVRTLLYLKLQNERMMPIRAANRSILVSNLSELWVLQLDLWDSSRQFLAKTPPILSQAVKVVRETFTEDFEPPPPEAFLMGQF